MFSDYSDVISVSDLMEMLDIGRSKALSLIQTGQIKSMKMKGYRIPKTAVIDFVLSQSKMNMERYRELANN
ncbi:helix-turn-helix domain-containing protein [Paenibacillus planticolens]|uniref:Helix-turn-helix domain-containing protein n=1 Tax=Paenibacillus planticolens TaxID=2654976 RepID=A0ABX1ZI71_9BACL|nr:helix-turn-helix domain-containing protein [Paenibacillus planticolens]NOU99783.1 helix-turn-helix domain-containing protein [Paenibacillus planticolens]